MAFEPTGLIWENRGFDRFLDQISTIENFYNRLLKVQREVADTQQRVDGAVARSTRAQERSSQASDRQAQAQERQARAARRSATAQDSTAAAADRSAQASDRLTRSRNREIQSIQRSLNTIRNLRRTYGQAGLSGRQLETILRQLSNQHVRHGGVAQENIQTLRQLQRQYHSTGISAQQLGDIEQRLQRARSQTRGRQALGGIASAPRTNFQQVIREAAAAQRETSGFQSRLQDLSRTLNEASRGAGGYHTQLGRIAQGSSEITAGLATVIPSINATTIALGLGAGAIISFFALGARGAATQGLIDAFRRTGVSLEELDAAAQGTVARLELIRLTNISLTGTTGELREELGERLPQLLEVARVQARDTGQNVNFLFNSLVTGIKRSSPLLIDNTGLLVKRGEANRQLAEELGKTTEQLTAQEQQLALLNAVLEAGSRAVEENVGAQETAAEKISRIRSSVTNILDELAFGLQPLFEGVLDIFLSLVEGAEDIVHPIATALFGIGRIVQQLIGVINRAVGPALQPIVDLASGVVSAFSEAGKRLVLALATTIGFLVSVIEEGLFSSITRIDDYLNEIRLRIEGSSPPIKGPLRNIDVGGRKTMEAWIDGLVSADIRPVEQVAREVSESLGGIATFSLDQIKARLAELDAEVQPFIDQLDIIEARFLSIQQSAQRALDALDREIDRRLQSVADGDAQAAAIVRSLDARREAVQQNINAEQALVDQAAIQVELVREAQAEERVLLGIRRRAFDETEERERRARARRARARRAARGDPEIPEPEEVGVSRLEAGDFGTGAFLDDDFLQQIERAFTRGRVAGVDQEVITREQEQVQSDIESANRRLDILAQQDRLTAEDIEEQNQLFDQINLLEQERGRARARDFVTTGLTPEQAAQLAEFDRLITEERERVESTAPLRGLNALFGIPIAASPQQRQLEVQRSEFLRGIVPEDLQGSLRDLGLLEPSFRDQLGETVGGIYDAIVGAIPVSFNVQAGDVAPGDLFGDPRQQLSPDTLIRQAGFRPTLAPSELGGFGFGAGRRPLAGGRQGSLLDSIASLRGAFTDTSLFDFEGLPGNLEENLVAPMRTAISRVIGFIVETPDSENPNQTLRKAYITAVDIPQVFEPTLRANLSTSFLTPVIAFTNAAVGRLIGAEGHPALESGEYSFGGALSFLMAGPEDEEGTVAWSLLQGLIQFEAFPEKLRLALQPVGRVVWDTFGSPILQILNRVIDGFNQFINDLRASGGPLGGIGGAFVNLNRVPTNFPEFLQPALPGAQLGGLFGPGAVMVGEGGPEILMPAQQFAVFPHRLTRALGQLESIVAQPHNQYLYTGGGAGQTRNTRIQQTSVVQNNSISVRDGADLRQREAIRRIRPR